MVSEKTLIKNSIKNFKKLINIILLYNKDIDVIYAPPKPVYIDSMPVVIVKYDPQKHLQRIAINKLYGYGNISERIIKGIDYDLFNYTDYMPSIDTVLNNTINGYKSTIKR